MSIEDNIVLKRPDIKQSTLATYMNSLKNLRKRIDEKTDLEDTGFLQNYEKVMKALNDMKLTTKKNKITSVLVELDAETKKDEKLIDRYQKALKNLNDEYVKFLKTQTKTDTQKENWLEYDDLVQVFNDIMADVKHNKIGKKDSLDNKDFDLLQQLVILRTYLDHPVRNDFADMRVITSKEEKKLSEDDEGNYLVLLPKNKKQFVLNDFKNRDKIGKKRLDVSPPLNKIINLWLKHNKSGYYLVMKDRKRPLNPNGITKYLNKIFMKRTNKKIGSSLIRHIVISKVTENQPTILEEEKKAQDIEDKFLHSGGMNKLYRKVD